MIQANSSNNMKTIAVLLALLLVTGALLINVPVQASTTNDSGGDDSNSGGDEGGGGGDNGDNGNGDDSEPEPEPEPETPPPMQTDEPPAPAETLPEAALIPEQPELIECIEGYVLDNNDKCVPDPLTKLGELVGPPPECPPELGLTPLECLDEIVNPTEDLPPQTPLESPSPERDVLPYCDKVEDDPNYTGGCHDREDYDELTGLYPCNDGSQEEDWRDCKDAYVPPPKPCDPKTDENCNPPCKECPPGEVCAAVCEPLPPCKDEYKLIDGKCVPEPPTEPECPPGFDLRDDVCHKEITIIINHIIKEVKDNNKHGHDNFPEIDIIGLSTKENGDSNVCLINIDEEHVQCQEFGMASDRVNGDFWRVIETDHSKDYDNGNTGSNDINGVIEDIKSQDFSELDDATNHDFDIDMAWIAINPQGDGVACLAEDSTGKGKSLCEPFKVSSQEISGQITEGVAIG